MVHRDMINNLQLKLGIDPENKVKTELLRLLVDDARLSIESELNRPEIKELPDELELLAENLVFDSWRINNYGKEEAQQQVSSATDQGQSVSYSTSKADLSKSMTDMLRENKGYYATIRIFRKMRW